MESPYVLFVQKRLNRDIHDLNVYISFLWTFIFPFFKRLYFLSLNVYISFFWTFKLHKLNDKHKSIQRILFYIVSKVEETLALTSSVSDFVSMNPPVKSLLILTNVWKKNWYYLRLVNQSPGSQSQSYFFLSLAFWRRHAHALNPCFQ